MQMTMASIRKLVFDESATALSWSAPGIIATTTAKFSTKGSSKQKQTAKVKARQNQKSKQAANATIDKCLLHPSSSTTFCDIGANLTDPVFMGMYRGKQKHESDFDLVLERAMDAGVEQVIVTAGNLEESRAALKLVKAQRSLPQAQQARQARLYCTVGVHPTRCDEFEVKAGTGGDGTGADAVDAAEAHLLALKELCDVASADAAAFGGDPLVVAIGECGLDYDRTEFCARDVQLRNFQRQFALAEHTGLPMFLHCRAAQDDMLRLCRAHRQRFKTGVVHSFDGSAAEAAAFVELGLHIGLNGCSLKTAENLDVVKTIPVGNLMLETDAPWCDIRPTHAGFAHVRSMWPQCKPDKHRRGSCVKGRNEPCTMRQVLEVVAGVRGDDPLVLGNQVLENTLRVFLPNHRNSAQ